MKNHGCHPFGNAKARAVVWNFPDPVPQHREPLYSPRPTWSPSTRRTTTRRRSGACPRCTRVVQEKNKDIGKDFPLVMTSGRLVEYEGGGEETRSNPWLAELQQDMFVEINPKDANDRGIRNGEWVWVKTPTDEGARSSRSRRWSPSAWRRHGVPALPLLRLVAGRKDLLEYYPEGAMPVVRGEASTPPPPTATTR
jgi:formate dehydrogenase major subunit